MTRYQRIISFLIVLMILFSQGIAYADGGYAYNEGVDVLYSDGFATLENWDQQQNVSIIQTDTGKALKLTGTCEVPVSKERYSALAASAVISLSKGKSSGYAGLAILEGQDGSRYEVRFYDKSRLELVKKQASGEKLLFSGAVDKRTQPDKFELKISAVDGYIRAMCDDIVIATVYDGEYLSDGTVTMLTNNSTAVFSSVKIETESSYIYENFTSQQPFSEKGVIEPQITVGSPDGEWVIAEKDDTRVLTTKGTSLMSRINFPAPKPYTASAVILNVKSDSWNVEETDGGLIIYQRFTAGNKNYRLNIHNNQLDIEKQTPSGIVKLKKGSALNIRNSTYHEVAFEAIEKNNCIELSGYIDGDLVVNYTDSSELYTQGGTAVETNGSYKAYIDELNIIKLETDTTLRILYSEGRKSKGIDVILNEEPFGVSKAPFLSENEVIMAADDIAQIINADIIYSADKNTVTISKGEIRISATAGDKSGFINGDAVPMYAQAHMADGTLMVPVRFFIEPFGAKMSFDETIRTAEIEYDESRFEGAEFYINDGVVFAMSPDGTSFRFLKLSGVNAGYTGNDATPLWRLWYVDSNVRQKNATKVQTGIFYQQAWESGDCTADSTQAKLVSKEWNQETGQLVLGYQHDRTDVTVNLSIKDNGVDIKAGIKNKCEDPVQMISVPSSWSVYYTKNNTIIMPLSNGAIEYESINWNYYDSIGSAFDGFMINGDRLFASYYTQDSYKNEDKPYLATQSVYNGAKTNQYRMSVENNTIVWREKGEAVEGINLSMRVYDTMRDWADDYVLRNYGEMRTALEKVQEQDRATFPKSYMIYLNNGRFSEFSELSKYMPGHVQFHLGTAMHLNEEQSEYSNFDAFPNYFPPNEKWGTMQDYKNFVSTLNSGGHFYMPRTSHYYYTEGSDVDLKYASEGGGASLAIRRIDGKPQQATWGLPGWLYSPFSKNANEYLEDSFKIWTEELGATTYFTNVVAIMQAYGHRYDFHPDGSSPDLIHDQLLKNFKYFGEQIPIFGEGSSGSRVPYQLGMMSDPRWDPDTEVVSYMKAESRGRFIQSRPDIGCVLQSEYIRYYPHNIGEGGQTSFRALTHSFMYNTALKTSVDLSVEKRDSKWRWIRAQAILADLISSRLFGARAEDEEELLTEDGVKRMNYSGNIVTANFSENGYSLGNNEITRNGYDFKSADGLVESGVYNIYNGHKFEEPQLIIKENVESGMKVYAPVAGSAFKICVPLDGITNPKITAHYADGTTTEISGIAGKTGVMFEYPYFDAAQTNAQNIKCSTGKEFEVKTSKIIPYVEIAENTETAGEMKQCVYIDGALSAQSYNGLSSLPDVVTGEIRIENYTGGEISGSLNISGNYFGEMVNKTIEVKTSELVSTYTVQFAKTADSTDTGASLSITEEGLNPISMPDKLEITPMVYPDMADINEISKEYDVAVDWDMVNPSDLKGVEFKAYDCDNPNGTGYVLKPGGYMTFGGENIVYKDKIYFEILIKFNDTRNYSSKEQMLITAMNYENTAKMGRSMEFRYAPDFDAFRFLMTSSQGYGDVTDKYFEVEPNKWYHVIAKYDGSVLTINVNGQVTTANYSKGILSYDGPLKVGGSIDAEIAYIRIAGK